MFPGHAAAAPAPLKTLAQTLYPLYESYFVRTVYHIKLVFERIIPSTDVELCGNIWTPESPGCLKGEHGTYGGSR